jgi:hypothetical protein
MQGITIGIGSQGIHFFIEHYLKDVLTRKFHEIRQNRTIYVGPGPQYNWDRSDLRNWFGSYDSGAAQLNVQLSGGTLENFNPVFNGVKQGANGSFDLGFTTSNFDMEYQWAEAYLYQWRDSGCDPTDPNTDCTVHYDPNKNSGLLGSFKVNYAQLVISLKVLFTFNSDSKVWEFKAQDFSAPTVKPGPLPSVPGRSWVKASESCFSTHASDQSKSAITSIDFAQLMNDGIQGILATIPASGDMGDLIKYDFSLGDQGLVFPGNNGLQIGIRGGASYNNVPSPPKAAPPLPLPAPPADADTHHLNMYVSGTELDALYWACWKANKLNQKITKTDLDTPALLDTNNYSVDYIAQYPDCAMMLEVSPTEAPITTFQKVWIYDADVMRKLQADLRPDVWKCIKNWGGTAFVSKDVLETKLHKDAEHHHVQLTPGEIESIEQAGSQKGGGMVMTSHLKVTLLIDNSANPLPYITVPVTRTDVFTELALDHGPNQTQTLKHSFISAGFIASKGGVETNVPGFTWSDGFAANFWQLIGEPAYDSAIKHIGKNGSPLPITAGLKFDFTNAELNVQDGYVWIKAKVEYK